ncbi:MAG: 16S rRNA (uracil(1498)-N(3))-methyltransferase [Actinomycetia bacterium]|nr:16S rRNA (uracil(1498)-N(3))-methyltransferase [Actinomycetes bacterium]
MEPDALRRRPLVFVDDLDTPELHPDDLHHFQRVLRLEPGQEITLGDGTGRWCRAEFGAMPIPTGPIASVTAPTSTVIVGFVPVKGTRPEWVVQKLTELGVDEIVPLVSTRSVVRWDQGRQDRQVQRMAMSARQACLQCRRPTLPRLGPVLGLAEFVVAHQGAVLADPGGRAPEAGDRAIAIGPEGGFTAEEATLAPLVALPGHVLRAETAALVAGTVLCGLRSGLVAPPPR